MSPKMVFQWSHRDHGSHTQYPEPVGEGGQEGEEGKAGEEKKTDIYVCMFYMHVAVGRTPLLLHVRTGLNSL